MKKVTQSQKILALLKSNKIVTRKMIAKRLRVREDFVSSYVAELVRVYKTRIAHKKGTAEYRLTK